MTSPSPWVLVCAGEASGDWFTAPVVEELHRRRPALKFFGAGGDQLAQADVELRHHLEDLAVTGLTEVASRARGVWNLIWDLRREILRRRPCLALLVDYPGVNLRLARICQRARIPVLYYIAPQRWAWLSSRTAPLRDFIDTLAVTLPFEERWFQKRGVDARFVGHPLLDLFQPVDRSQARIQLRADDKPVLALLPGSRPNEVKRHLPILLACLGRLPSGLVPVLATLPGSEASRLGYAAAPQLQQGSTALTLSAADVALCASGSATLELALAGVPAAVFYRLSPLSYQVARHLVRLSKIALPNIILGESVLPEFVQEQMTPETLAAVVQQLLDPRTGQRVRDGLRRVVASLGAPGVASRVVDLAESLLRQSRRRQIEIPRRAVD
jgi:lipid-A-disaccharide synthase